MEGIYLFLPVRDLNGFNALPEGNQMKSQASAAAEYPKPASIWREDRSFPCKNFILFYFCLSRTEHRGKKVNQHGYKISAGVCSSHSSATFIQAQIKHAKA